MARGDVVFRRHALEGVEPPKKTKRIKSGSKAMTSSFSRDPQTASAGLVEHEAVVVEAEPVVEKPTAAKPETKKRRAKKDS